MSNNQPVTEDTLFLLADLQKAFAEHFGEEIKSLSTICRYTRGVRIPISDKTVKLGTVFTPSRARKTSLRLWRKFLEDLQAAYLEAMAMEDGDAKASG